MFQSNRRKSGLGATLAILELIYHSIVYNIRKGSSNAIVGLLKNIMQACILVVVFYVMMSVLGMRSLAIRGSFILFIMTGVFLYMTHIKAMGAVLGSDGPTSPMMRHAPMNTVISIVAAALACLYTQILSMAVILFVADIIIEPIEIYNPRGVILPIILAWASGVVVGLVFLALKPWFPTLVGLASQLWSRANMIASGKMFLANNMGAKVALFSWNPLFHVIDQTRGEAFNNYYPRFTNLEYPLYFCIALLVIGLMGEFYTRQRASSSWDAKR